MPHPLDLRPFPATTGAAGQEPRPAVLVLPGGGYRVHAAHEGEGYAHWLAGLGLHAFVLHYPLQPEHGFPAPLRHARWALQYVADGCHGLDVDPRRVGVIGSSAGGHLAALLSTGTVLPGETLPQPPRRPAFAVLAYPVTDLANLDESSLIRLFGAGGGLLDALSPARHVDAATCPTFLWATAEDAMGMTNTLAYAAALAESSVPVEMHVYAHGRHGLGLADGIRFGEWGDSEDPHVAQWASACAAWLAVNGWIEE